MATLAAGPAWAEPRIGVTPGGLADSIPVAAAEAKAKGLDARVVEFSDWTTPNVPLGRGDFAGRALLSSGVDDLACAIRFVARADRADTPEIRQLIDHDRSSPAVRARIDAAFAHDAALYSLPWLR